MNMKLSIEQFLNEVSMVIKSKKFTREEINKISSGEKFEIYVVKTMKEIACKYQVNIEHTGPQTFPDIIIDERFGIEVKFSTGEKWESLGNSVFESTAREHLDQIYLLFGKKSDNKIDVLWDLYENCLQDIKVTHSPRFTINISHKVTGKKESYVFDHLEISYSQFKQLDKKGKGKIVKEYLKRTISDKEGIWYLDETEGEAITPRVKDLRNVDRNLKTKIIAESMAYFPEVFSTKSTKYLNVSIYLLKRYQIISSSLRDIFSASGKQVIVVNGKNYEVSQIYGKLYKLALPIKSILQKTDTEELREYWREHPKQIIKLNTENKVMVWKEILNSVGIKEYNDLLPSVIFDEGVKATSSSQNM